MEFEQIIALIDHVSDSKLTSFQYKTEELKLSMECGKVQTIAAPGVDMSALPTMPAVQAASVASVEEPADQQGNLVKSPLVGTFYAAPSEDAKPFVSVGDKVKKGQILAIVEAMKLMNDIESEFDGEVAEIYVQNGDAVEYGQPLFRIV